MPLTVNMNDEQEVTVTLNPVDVKGKPAQVFGVPVWTLQSGACTVTPAADGLSALIVASPTPGTSVVGVQAEGDVTPGVDTLNDTVTLNISTADAVSLGLAAGTPITQP